jgi:hypothetical protein
MASHFYFHALIFQSESAATFSRINTALSGRGQNEMATTRRSRNGAQKVRIHNPGTLGAVLPGIERKVRAATRTANKRKGAKRGGSRRRRNTTTRRTANTSTTRKLNTAAARTPNRKRRSTRRRRNTGLRRINAGFSIGGLTLTQMLATGAGALVVSIGGNIFGNAVQNKWARIGLQFGLAWGVSRFAPRSVNGPATAGALTVPVVSLVNELVPNLQGRLASLIPIGPAPAATGVGQLVDVNPALFTGGGMGQLAYVPAQSEYMS